ncbi:hypothetical protein HLH34_04515 [Gluconacetobacter azotocaptans]|uniref:Uncharacterized protein n=1 Tax=Gluconacetobacter azotocaptans TaxID=142834 RepID=A0A7W4JQU2_9PROT|nr:hypothetical protein [Gluconacetobacter azotocaptans]MBB2189227.1 hypothetical protein [Gluconacetobacter azotocaptans]GBQ32323.1 hypothetical protein AA13594_2336 [Gluconacetobacter azotocaptans DSM 13594]
MNTATRVSGIAGALSALLLCLPAQYSLYAAWLVVTCAAISAGVPAPAPGSRWGPIYRAINVVALNVGWAANRLRDANSPAESDTAPPA